MAIAIGVIFGSAVGLTQEAAKESGHCSLEQAVPVTVARVDETLEMLLDDGRRTVLSGLDFPQYGTDAPELRKKAGERLSNWLVGRQVFFVGLRAAPDRWGRIPSRLFASRSDESDSPMIGVGETLIAEGLARFRPDRAAYPCASLYFAAEGIARAKKAGLWASADFSVVNAGDPKDFGNRKGMIVVEGVVQSIGEAGGLFYLNFGPRRGVDFAVVIMKRNSAVFDRAGLSPKGLNGRRVRIRGMIETSNGLRMEVATPAEIELVGAPP
jgi:endonuclease YncB( thermonuclease family)